MGMWHCETTRILEINPYGNADTLEIARVWDYEVIIRKGEYKVGDLVSYLAVETICGGNPTFSFLGKDAFRPLRAKRLRGVFSQGLIVPAPPGWTEENVSVVEFYGLVRAPEKEEKIEGKISRGSDGIKVFGTSGHTESPPFPLGVYDVDPLKKFASTLEEGEEVYITEKIHGENHVLTFHEKRLWSRSRQHWKKREEDSRWWTVALRDGFEKKLAKYPNLIFYGELYGNNSFFRYDCPIVDGYAQRRFRVFDIKDKETNAYLHPDRVQEICKDLGIDTVPVLYRGPWKTDRSLYILAEGRSTLNENVIREGFVVRSLTNPQLENGSRKVFKLISPEYLLLK